MERLFGIPAHPLLVHLPVVLTPVVCLAALAIAVRPAWRKRFGLFVLGGALVSFIATFLATQSGEGLIALDEEFREVSKNHAELGETTRLFAFVLLVAVAVLVFLGRRAGGSRASTGSRLNVAQTVVAGIMVVAAVLNTVWMVRTGHEGARIVWETVGK